MQIPPDYTFFVQIALFVVFWLLLKRLWFDPALKITRERAVRSEGAIKEARAIQAEAEQLRAQHAAALDEVRSETQREMQEILRAAEQEQKRLIAEAREEAQRTLEAVQARINEEVATARQSLREQARDIAHEVVRKVLGRAA
jgi:F-type H+-transporting ATPase subunit b